MKLNGIDLVTDEMVPESTYLYVSGGEVDNKDTAIPANGGPSQSVINHKRKCDKCHNRSDCFTKSLLDRDGVGDTSKLPVEKVSSR